MSAARIGKIRMKAGGAEVRVLRTDTSKASDQSEFVSTLLDVRRGAREGTIVACDVVNRANGYDPE